MPPLLLFEMLELAVSPTAEIVVVLAAASVVVLLLLVEVVIVVEGANAAPLPAGAAQALLLAVSILRAGSRKYPSSNLRYMYIYMCVYLVH